MLPTGGIRLFRVFGITVYLHWMWFLMAIYELQDRKGEYSSLGWNIAEYLSLFGIVLLHEFGHALACRSVGGKAERIVLWPFGGVAYVSPPPRPGAWLWSIAAGPLVNVVLLIATFPLLRIQPDTDLLQLIRSIAWINLVLLIFNILPIYPLDGGKILQALLWFVIGRSKSLIVASVIGMAGAVGLFFLIGSLQGSYGLYLILITIWMTLMAWRGFQQALAMRRMEQIPRRPEFRCPSCGKPPMAAAVWRCSRCGSPFDTFERGAVCPRCGHFHNITICPECGVTSPMAAWQQNPQNVPGFYNPPGMPPGTSQMPFIPPQPPPGAPEIRLPNSGNPTS